MKRLFLALCLLPSALMGADVTVTAASVARVTGTGTETDTKITTGYAGATITAGQVLYKDTSAGTWKLADANLSAAAGRSEGIALNGAATGQPIAVATGGTLTGGFTATVGTIYVLSANAGGIAPAADLASGWRTGVVGVGLTSTTIGLVLYSSGVAVP